jgi:ribosomal protein S18 acetylase RimI-like enzyme
VTRETTGVIRQAEPQDAERCGEIAVLAWRRVFEAWEALLGPRIFAQHYGDWRERKRAEVAGFIREHPEKGVVTEVDGQVVGFLTFYLPGAPGVGEIGNNAVHPDWQGKGIGERQCKRALDTFREMGLTSATVYTGLDEGHAPARAQYRKAGFRLSTPHIKYFAEL